MIPTTTQHYPILRRNLVYTAVTCGKRLGVLVGQRKALAIAVKGARARRRWSKLREWLKRDRAIGYTWRYGSQTTDARRSVAISKEEGAVPDFLRMDKPVSSDPANAKTGKWHGWPTNTKDIARLIRPVEQVFKPTRPEWIAHRDFTPI